MLTKQQWLDRAEVIDAYRVFPRLLLLSAFLFLCWYSWFALTTIICLADRMSTSSGCDRSQVRKLSKIVSRSCTCVVQI